MTNLMNIDIREDVDNDNKYTITVNNLTSVQVNEIEDIVMHRYYNSIRYITATRVIWWNNEFN